jgi:hypothetical protein
MPILAKDWYETEIDYTAFYQGDIIRDVPVTFLPHKISKWFILRPGANSKQHVDDVLRGDICKWFEAFPEGQLADKWKHGQREEFVAAKAYLCNVILLTQTCDLENRNYYQIAPIYPETKQKLTALENLRENNLNYAFYLPALAPYLTENSYGELAHTCAVPKAYFPKNAVAQVLAARLKNHSRIALQSHVANYFGRPFGFSAKDRASVAGDYYCVSCFFTSGVSVKTTMQAGNTFASCEKCQKALWIRVPAPK